MVSFWNLIFKEFKKTLCSSCISRYVEGNLRATFCVPVFKLCFIFCHVRWTRSDALVRVRNPGAEILFVASVWRESQFLSSYLSSQLATMMQGGVLSFPEDKPLFSTLYICLWGHCFSSCNYCYYNSLDAYHRTCTKYILDNCFS